MPTAYALVIINILCIMVCYQVAKGRRADVRFWGWMGVIVGPLAVPLVFFSRPKANKNSSLKPQSQDK